MANMKFKITNITCSACVKLSTMALKNIPDVTKVAVEESGSVEITADKEISWSEVCVALQKVGKNAAQC